MGLWCARAHQKFHSSCTPAYIAYLVVLHCTALHCTALHCTALHCTVLYYTYVAKDFDQSTNNFITVTVFVNYLVHSPRYLLANCDDCSIETYFTYIVLVQLTPQLLQISGGLKLMAGVSAWTVGYTRHYGWRHWGRPCNKCCRVGAHSHRATKHFHNMYQTETFCLPYLRHCTTVVRHKQHQHDVSVWVSLI